MNATRKINLEQILYLSIFLLALAIRLVNLGKVPLNDDEAGFALQAFRLAAQQNPVVGTQPGYMLFTGVLNFLFGSSNLLARLLPALVGSLLVLLPAGVKSRLGRMPALILALGLAVDPGMAAASRWVGSPILALVFVLAAVVLWMLDAPVVAGISLGLGVLGGPGFFPGLAGLLIPAALVYWFDQKSGASLPKAEGAPFRNHLGTALLWAAGTVLAAGSLFMIYPRGLSGVLGSLVDYFAGWTRTSGVPPMRLLAALAVYQPIPLLFGVIAIVRGLRKWEPVTWFLGLWAVTELLLAAVYPSRQVTDLVWVVVPLWCLAAFTLSSLVKVRDEDRIQAFGLAALSLALFAYGWINMSALANTAPGAQDIPLHWMSMGAVLVFILLAALLVAWSWGLAPAVGGLGIGVGIGLALLTIGGTIGAAGLKANTTQELWSPDRTNPHVDFLVETMDDLSLWKAGAAGALDVAVVGVPSPALQWLLRNNPRAVFVDQIAADEKPALVISASEQQPSLAAAYSGQDFVWSSMVNWDALPPSSWPIWLLYRQAPEIDYQVILWARSDVFPGGGVKPTVP